MSVTNFVISVFFLNFGMKMKAQSSPNCIWPKTMAKAIMVFFLGEAGEAGQMDPERQFLEERHWILSVINDGLRDKLDYSVCQQQYLFKILMAFYPCSLADKNSRLLIASILDKVTQLQPVQPVLELIKNQGLLPWIADQVLLLMSTLLCF